MFQNAKYIKGLTDIKDQPDSRPIVLLLGRSNVGKSSFINSITNRKSLARTSQTPGKTVVLNYYLIDDTFYLVDAPGYGYAKRSKTDQDNFVIMLENILMNASNLKLVCLLIDFKVGPTTLDLETCEFVKSLGHTPIVIATKLDKIPKTKQYKQMKDIKMKFHDKIDIYAISNLEKQGLDDIRIRIMEGFK